MSELRTTPEQRAELRALLDSIDGRRVMNFTVRTVEALLADAELAAEWEASVDCIRVKLVEGELFSPYSEKVWKHFRKAFDASPAGQVTISRELFYGHIVGVIRKLEAFIAQGHRADAELAKRAKELEAQVTELRLLYEDRDTNRRHDDAMKNEGYDEGFSAGVDVARSERQ